MAWRCGLAVSQAVGLAAGLGGAWLAWLTCCLGQWRRRARGPMMRSTLMKAYIKSGQLFSARECTSLGVDKWL